jgi:hypothetical protein
MSQSSISINDEESRVGTGAPGLPFDNRRGWSTMPDPAPIPQDPSSTPQDDRAYMKLLLDYTLYPSDHSNVRPLAVNSYVYSGLLCCSYLRLPTREASPMTLNFVTRTSLPRTL